MNEDKIKNLLLHFAESIPELPITKAMKLFFYVDFAHFAKTGSSVTGLDYHCWDQGPVPPVVHKRLDKGRFDFIMPLEKKGRSHIIKSTPGTKANLSIFSKNEIDTINQTLMLKKDLNVTELSRQTHQELPWLKTERFGKISYEWAMLQKTVMDTGENPKDEEIIMDIIERNPALHQFFKNNLADWLDSTSDEESNKLLDDSDLTAVHWQKGVGLVQGH